jgi:hypothetical protein
MAAASLVACCSEASLDVVDVVDVAKVKPHFPSIYASRASGCRGLDLLAGHVTLSSPCSTSSQRRN